MSSCKVRLCTEYEPFGVLTKHGVHHEGIMSSDEDELEDYNDNMSDHDIEEEVAMLSRKIYELKKTIILKKVENIAVSNTIDSIEKRNAELNKRLFDIEEEMLMLNEAKKGEEEEEETGEESS